MQSLKTFISLVRSDLELYKEPFLKCVLFTPGFKYTFNHRLCYFLYQNRYLLYPLFILQLLYMKQLTYQVGIQLSWKVPLPRNFVIAHFGGITFFPRACGHHLYLRQGVTVGATRGAGLHPSIGNYVTFGANSIAIGAISIGNNVIIGAGSVVTHDVPDNCVVAGVPAKIIKQLPPLECADIDEQPVSWT